MTKIILLYTSSDINLKIIKGEKESFIQILKKLAFSNKKKNLISFAGMWSSDENAKKIYDKILSERSNIKLKLISW